MDIICSTYLLETLITEYLYARGIEIIDIHISQRIGPYVETTIGWEEFSYFKIYYVVKKLQFMYALECQLEMNEDFETEKKWTLTACGKEPTTCAEYLKISQAIKQIV